MASSDADQIADAIGKKIPARELGVEAPGIQKIAKGQVGAPAASRSAGASLLNRTISRSNRRCERRNRLRRCAKNPLAPRLLYSRPVRRHDTLNDMSESRADADLAKQAHQVRIRPVVVHQETGIERKAPCWIVDHNGGYDRRGADPFRKAKRCDGG
jgi:hypothetical protein